MLTQSAGAAEGQLSLSTLLGVVAPLLQQFILEGKASEDSGHEIKQVCCAMPRTVSLLPTAPLWQVTNTYCHCVACLKAATAPRTDVSQEHNPKFHRTMCLCCFAAVYLQTHQMLDYGNLASHCMHQSGAADWLLRCIANTMYLLGAPIIISHFIT